MKNSYELLNSDLLKKRDYLNKIDYWLSVMNRTQGWHYDLDIIWLIKNLKKYNINEGSTILDAGAGLGITQFILASMGYNIISLDFSKREIPQLSKNIFEIDIDDQKIKGYKHDYMGSVNYNGYSKSDNYLNKLVDVLFKKNFEEKIILLKSILSNSYNKVFNILEKKKNHKNFGKIKFIRAPFHDMPLKNNEVDSIVSVSALEHSDLNLLTKNLKEFKRVTKKNNPILITTSSTSKSNDIYHDKTKGWCFSKKTLNKIISSKENIEFDYYDVEQNLLDNKFFRKRIPSYYTSDPESEFYKSSFNHLPYLPVGIKIFGD